MERQRRSGTRYRSNVTQSLDSSSTLRKQPGRESDHDSDPGSSHYLTQRTTSSPDSLTASVALESDQTVALILRRHIEDWEKNFESCIQAWLPRLRKSLKVRQATSAAVSNSSTQRLSSNNWQSEWMQEKSPFLNLSATKKSNAAKATDHIKIVAIRTDGRPCQLAPTIQATRYKDNGVSVPPHTFHVQVHSNILTENNQKLNYNPTEIECEDPEWSPDVYEDELRERYTHGVPWDREKPLECAEISKQLRPAISRALRELGCSVDDLLRYIIDPNPSSAAKAEIRAEAEAEKAGPQSDWEQWVTVLSALPDSTIEAQKLAAEICKTFQEVVGFSMWYFVKDFQRTEPKSPEATPTGFQNYSSLMCRVCFTHLCTAHGEFEEDYEKATSKNEQIKYEPGNINYRLSVTSEDRRQRPSLNEPEFPRQLVRQRSHQYWRKNLELYSRIDFRNTLANSHREQFYPCNHEGPCDQAKCTCYEAGINCEKICGCSETCQRRYLGCNCARNGRVCFQSSKCSCWQMERECDPDLCSRCGAAEALDPRNRTEDIPAVRRCDNVSIQRNIPKRLLTGRSRVSGFGLFAGERVKKGDFLGEYRGELLSEPEADRRQILHQHLREYLFVVSQNQQIDSTYAGNKIRFVNNSCKAENINCYPIPLLCNGAIRMGLFAKRDMNAGEELFFNYGYSEHQVANFKEVVRAPAIASKSAKPTATKVAKKNVRRATGGRQSMIATSVTIPAPFKRNSRRVIDDSEDSGSEGDASDSVGRSHLTALRLDSTSEETEDVGNHVDDATGDESTEDHSEVASGEDEYMRTRGREARDRKRKRRAGH